MSKQKERTFKKLINNDPAFAQAIKKIDSLTLNNQNKEPQWKQSR